MMLAALAGSACTGLRGGGESPKRDAARTPAKSKITTPLGPARQLTFAGRRTGEGYFSRDGRQIVFQSEREPDNPFYQIYRMDLDTGSTIRVSPGVGKTTCAWIHPGGSKILFASTHADPKSVIKQEGEKSLRESGASRRYAWDYDEWFDLYERRMDVPDAKPRALAPARGYDAEAAYSPNGRQIVFASNRHAYAESLSGEARALFDESPSNLIDLYIMDAGGENLRRLTRGLGYDGGPFFSPDGTRIVFRHFEPGGAVAEIETIAIDGSDRRALTRLGAMSWAPFYHPSGDYVVFATNRHGMDNFELYIVDARGEHEPVRVTDAEGFDGLPVFSPDGRTLLWTRNRTSTGGSQLFLADWDDRLARELLGLPRVAATVVQTLLPLPARTDPRISDRDLRAWVAALTDPITEGRLTGTPGEKIATSFVGRAFRAIGLEPAGSNDTFFQPFGFTAGVSVGKENALRVEIQGAEDAGGPYQVDRDWRPLAFSKEGEVEASEIVFVGYGIVAPAVDGQQAVDSYKGVDAKDRWALAFRYVPEDLPDEAQRHLRHYSSARHKAMMARDHGARGLILVSGPRSKVNRQLIDLRFDASLGGTSLAAISIDDALAEALVAPSGRSLGELQRAADRSSQTRGFVLDGVRLGAKIDLERQRASGRNVLGRLQVGKAPTEDFVLVGAHVDHLGRGEGTSSLASDAERDQIHPGADDNASGVAAMLEIAQALVARRDAGELEGRRDVVFAAWSGEELGLLGSAHYANTAVDPHDPAAELRSKIVAYLNLDMVGRLEDSVTLNGMGSSPVWPALVEHFDVPLDLPVNPQNDGFVPSDATSFYAKGVPILSAFTGAHAQYHTPQDTADRLDYESMAEIGRLFAGVAGALAESESPPAYLAPSTNDRPALRGGLRVALGTIPDYSQTDVVGVKLSGVSADGAAAAAGIRGGDTVVELAGRKIENIYDYTFVLESLKVGEPVEIVIERAGERIPLEIVPGSRD